MFSTSCLNFHPSMSNSYHPKSTASHPQAYEAKSQIKNQLCDSHEISRVQWRGIRQWQISRFQFRMIFNPKSTTNPWTLTLNFEKEVEMPWPYMQKGQAESYPFTHLSYHTRSSIGISSSEVRAGNTTELQIPIERQLMVKLKNC